MSDRQVLLLRGQRVFFDLQSLPTVSHGGNTQAITFVDDYTTADSLPYFDPNPRITLMLWIACVVSSGSGASP